MEDMGAQAEIGLEQHFFRRLGRLAFVRRFVISWVLLFVLLIGGVGYQFLGLSNYYQTVKAVPGGIYTEGIIGSFGNANPIYATGPVDLAVSKLVFSGLLKYDQTGNLSDDLAGRWTVDEKGTTYKVNLRPDLFWHDGQPLTADDVVFTYQLIQNQETKSPLFASWQGVKVESKGPRTVVFTLPNALASFPYSLTNGIVPKHLLKDTPPAQLRSIPFDTVSPVGSGPFAWDAIEVRGDTPETRQEQIALKPFEKYHGGTPKLQQYRVRSFLNEKTMIDSFRKKELTAMSGLAQVPDELAKQNNVKEYNMPLMGQVGVFFRTSHELLQDAAVRRALVEAANQPEILKGMPYPVVSVRSPIMRFQVGYNKDLVQLPYNVADANALLDKAGWVKQPDGTRAKNGKPLKFELLAQNSSEYTYVTQELQKMWKAVGVQANVMLQSEEELQRPVSEHRYDALLYGISTGRDPDVFAYWHSTQASSLSSSRLNFSEYKSSAADKALEAGRTRSDNALRAVKYRPFLEAWRNDAPALMLYQPRYLYISNTNVYGLSSRMLNSASDRYANIQNWMIREVKSAE